jgi:predicted glycosyltransferase
MKLLAKRRESIGHRKLLPHPPNERDAEAAYRQSITTRQQTQLHQSPPPHPIRIALYSHDTMGLGHKRRNLLIAQTLARSLPQASILLISGMQEGRCVNLPDHVDYLSLPALHKDGEGEYQSRRLDVTLPELITIRSHVIQAAIQAFSPDLFIVDNVPRGAVQELNATLETLRAAGQTRCVLGLRDVLDEPNIVKQEWQKSLNQEAIAQYYDAVWVYGDASVFDLAQEYHFPPAIAHKVRYLGYLDQRQRLQYAAPPSAANTILEELCLPPGQLALCLVGGGQDGAELAQMFAQAARPPDMNGIIVTGPFMPLKDRQKLREYAASQERLRVLEYVEEPTQLLKLADQVVAMGGYNSVCELLSFGKRSLVVPRVTPRLEQWIRAERLCQLGWIDVLHPHHLSPDAITNWLAQSEATPKPRSKINLNGLEHLPQLVMDTLTRSSPLSNSLTYHAS